MTWLEDALGKLGIDRIHRIDLPAESRYPSRLARRLEPVEGRWGYWLLLCRGLRCRLCGFPERPRVYVERVRAEDVLSGLRHMVPRIVVECCSRRSVVGEWMGSRIRVDRVECPLELGPEGGRCWGSPCGSVEECLRACATRGP